MQLNDILIKLGIRKDPKDIKFHPKHEAAINYAFSVGKDHYYEFKSALDIPIKRLRLMKQFYSEMEMNIDKNTLVQFCEKIMGHLDKQQSAQAAILVDELKYRSTFAFEFSTLYRLASCTYFTLEENVKDYDFEYNDDKIENFKKKEATLKYFLATLLQNSNSLVGLSDYDFQAYSKNLAKKLAKQRKLISEAMPSEVSTPTI